MAPKASTPKLIKSSRPLLIPTWCSHQFMAARHPIRMAAQTVTATVRLALVRRINDLELRNLSAIYHARGVAE
jgi:hypothetical protein